MLFHVSRDLMSSFSVILPFILQKKKSVVIEVIFSVDSFSSAETLNIPCYYSTSLCGWLHLDVNISKLKLKLYFIHYFSYSRDNKSYIFIFRYPFFLHFISRVTWPEPHFMGFIILLFIYFVQPPQVEKHI